MATERTRVEVDISAWRERANDRSELVWEAAILGIYDAFTGALKNIELGDRLLVIAWASDGRVRPE